MGNFWHNKNVFVTGGNGFLGSHVVSQLLEKGAKPVVLVYEDNPGGIFEKHGLSEKTTVVRGDIRDRLLIETILADHAIDVVFHLAAQAIVDQAIDNPFETWEVNVQGTSNVLEACRKNAGVKHVIIASSDKAYGQHDNLPYVESVHDLRAAFPYEVSKACADMISQCYFRTFKLPISITRCANLYGPGDLKMNRLVPRTIHNLHTGIPPVIRDTGESMRDYLYVEDAAEAYLMLAEKMNADMHGEVFNFATNTPYSVRDAIAAISAEMGTSIEPTTIQTHGFEIRHQYASFEKAKKMIGWEPKHTFAEGLRKAIPWYLDHFAHAKKQTIAAISR